MDCNMAEVESGVHVNPPKIEIHDTLNSLKMMVTGLSNTVAMIMSHIQRNSGIESQVIPQFHPNSCPMQYVGPGAGPLNSQGRGPDTKHAPPFGKMEDWFTRDRARCFLCLSWGHKKLQCPLKTGRAPYDNGPPPVTGNGYHDFRSQNHVSQQGN